MEANKILSADILDLVFEDRNKEYGAYDLRKTYNRRITTALIITASIALIALGGSFLAKAFSNSNSKLDVKDVVLENIKQEEEKKAEPPPPPPKPKPPEVEMTKFTPPKIVKDEEVKKEDIPPEVEKLEDTKIDVKSQEGVKDEGLATPAEIDQGKQVIEEKKEDENQIFTKVEVEASFPGGEGAWRKYLERSLSTFNPGENGAAEGTYTVHVKFIVDKLGNISDVTALTNHGFGMEDEAVKVIKKGPKWVPALQNGRHVNAYRTQPITFIVNAE
ncbi:MAG: energy transducer TonB [Bacteroidota bacterium]|nr:energy transducer TonB [Bacteroidota bacterium]